MNNKKEKIILGIETSCDETASSVIKGNKILSNVVLSQIEIHKQFGGVVPEIASRKHVESINFVIEESLKKAKIKFSQLDAVGVTVGPGLSGSLTVGISAAKAIGVACRIPIVGVNHIEAHLFPSFFEREIAPPYIGLVVSGGHCELLFFEKVGKYESLGRTRDDAPGEAFDKIAKFFNLGYPGGPIIDKLSQKGDRERIHFPRAYIDKNNWEFSFSGLKTAVINFVRFKKGRASVKDIVSSFQEALIEVLVEKTLKAAKKYRINKVIIGGGVASNSRLRQMFEERKNNVEVIIPPKALCTDNACMIAKVSHCYLEEHKVEFPFGMDLTPSPELPLR